MKKRLFLIIAAVVLFFIYRYDPRSGVGGEDALIKSGQTQKPLALVTGSSRGIGAELAKLLDKKGYRVIIHGRNKQRLTAVASELTNPQIVVADFATEQGRQKIFDVIRSQTPELVVNNAGILGSKRPGPVITNDISFYNTMLEVNSRALMDITYEAVKAMHSIKKKGIVVNISSVAAEIAPMPGLSVYSATKSFVTNFSIAFDYELADTGIRVLTNNPGVVATSRKRKAQRGPMSASYAAEEIFYQIEKRKTVYTFDRKFRISVLLNRLIPNFITMPVKARISMSDTDAKNVSSES